MHPTLSAHRSAGLVLTSLHLRQGQAEGVGRSRDDTVLIRHTMPKPFFPTGAGMTRWEETE